MDCALRETREELGISVSADAISWSRKFSNTVPGRSPAWFFVALAAAQELGEVRLGDEGQAWRWLNLDDFLEHPLAVPHLTQRLRLYLDGISPRG